VTVDGENPEWASELRTLATIAALAHRSPTVQQGLQSGLREIARAVQAKLPEGVEIHFDEPTCAGCLGGGEEGPDTGST
jgi:hypothetical protein